MSRSRGRAGPSDPQDILRRNAELRAAARHVDSTPELWGVSAELYNLPTAADVDLNHDNAGRLVGARRRSDPFELLQARGALSDGQHRAADRLYRDWALRSGARDYPERQMLERIDGGQNGRHDGVSQIMIDAGRRIAVALQGVGPVNARLLQALISPFAAGEVRAWRAIVERVTGESEKNAQSALVRQACEALRLVYEAIDERTRRADIEQMPAQLRPFGTFEPIDT